MKVNRPEIIQLINKLSKQHQTRGRDQSPAVPSRAAGDRVEISADSEILKKELARLGASNAPREAKLAELTRRIDNGEYTIDNDELAEIILQSMEKESTLGF